MAANQIRLGGRRYKDGDLLVAPCMEPVYRLASGQLSAVEPLFLVYYNEEEDVMSLVPLPWEVAKRLFKETLHDEVDRVRPRSI